MEKSLAVSRSIGDDYGTALFHIAIGEGTRMHEDKDAAG